MFSLGTYIATINYTSLMFNVSLVPQPQNEVKNRIEKEENQIKQSYLNCPQGSNCSYPIMPKY